uniref:Protein phosphatase 1 regulatory subunit 21 n=1 Tax=Salmo trutta TaxID=8032 RepID=A0A673Y805_SALTR
MGSHVLQTPCHTLGRKWIAQNQVLKKGVVDEQASSTSLKDQVKQREQSLRKVEQEMDSLTFRNQQLAKRVELLQEELAASEAKGKKSKNKGDSPSQQGLQQTQSVFDEDLQKKIQENERLHIQFYEADEQHRQQESQLKGRLEQLERDHEQHQAIVDGLTSKYMGTIERLQSDKARLEVKSQTLEREAKECRMNSPPQSSPQFSQYLHENAAYVRPLEEGLVQLHQSITEDTVTVLETVGKLKDFADHFTSYTHFLQKILPYQLKSLEEECGTPLCTSSLTSKNQELQSDMKRITSLFDKLHSYISLLALPSELTHRGEERSSSSAVFTQLAACLHSLHDAVKEMSTHYSQKASLEQELSTVTQKLRTTNECLLASLGSLTSSTGKIATFFSNNLDFFTSSTGYSPRGGAGSLNPLQAESMLGNKKKASDYMHAIRKPRPESVPYREALLHRRVLTSSTESREGLTQQVVASQEKIARLEQEKEHWLLEAQLGRVRLEKESQRIQDLETQLSFALGGGGSPAHSLGQAPGSPALTSLEDGEGEERGAGKEAMLSNSLVGMLTTTPTNEEVGDEESREQLIKTHYMARVGELTTQLQVSDSKAVNFHAEVRYWIYFPFINAELLFPIECKRMCSSFDELATTKRSYKEQLSMMSDHLCSMNETLSKQREEIDTLKLGSKGNSKLLKKSR